MVIRSPPTMSPLAGTAESSEPSTTFHPLHSLSGHFLLTTSTKVYTGSPEVRSEDQDGSKYPSIRQSFQRSFTEGLLALYHTPTRSFAHSLSSLHITATERDHCSPPDVRQRLGSPVTARSASPELPQSLSAREQQHLLSRQPTRQTTSLKATEQGFLTLQGVPPKTPKREAIFSPQGTLQCKNTVPALPAPSTSALPEPSCPAQAQSTPSTSEYTSLLETLSEEDESEISAGEFSGFTGSEVGFKISPDISRGLEPLCSGEPSIPLLLMSIITLTCFQAFTVRAGTLQAACSKRRERLRHSRYPSTRFHSRRSERDLSKVGSRSLYLFAPNYSSPAQHFLLHRSTVRCEGKGGRDCTSLV